uniref:Putative phosphatidylinositol transfer protein sec14 n=1 Tax=Panstrongylus megistus TaxID=65343 RepID=A0A069DTA5_9HEMI
MAATRVIMVRPWESNSTDGDEDEIAKVKQEEMCNILLSEEAAKVARRELREDESTKQQALEQIIEWINKNPDLKDCRTDSNFLLRFLRAKKFSVMMAQEMLLKYLNLRQTFPQLLMNLDYLQTPILQLIDKGYLFPSPVRDKKGRRVIIGMAANFDPQQYNCEDMAKVHMLTYEALLEEEDTQVFGFTHFGDFRTMSTAHVMLWSPTVFATIFKWGEQSVPMRHKEVHFINVPSALKYVYDFTRSRLSQKIRDRFTIHGNLSELHSKLDPSILPKEYGGVIPMAQMIETWKQQLAEKRERIMALDKMKLLDNKCILKKDGNNNKNKTSTSSLSITGSFRKLEVD